MSNEKKNVMDFLREQSAQLPLMEGKDKGDIKQILDTTLTVTDYGFLNNEAGEPYAVFTVKELPNFFFFGGQVPTDRFLMMDKNGYREDILGGNLKIVLSEKRARKSGKTYVDMSPAEA